MPADFLSRNVVESIDILDEDLATAEMKDGLCQVIRNIMHNYTNTPELRKIENWLQNCSRIL